VLNTIKQQQQTNVHVQRVMGSDSFGFKV
jgi:hypothetical protein